MKRSEHTKKQIEIATARFVRKAAGRLSKRECAKLGVLYGEDLHWRCYASADRLARRAPGEIVADWKAYLAAAFRADVAAYGDGAWNNGPTLAHRRAMLFCWYGPNNGLFPGDTLVLRPADEGGRCGGWVVQCHSACVCNACTARKRARPGLAKASVVESANMAASL